MNGQALPQDLEHVREQFRVSAAAGRQIIVEADRMRAQRDWLRVLLSHLLKHIDNQGPDAPRPPAYHAARTLLQTAEQIPADANSPRLGVLGDDLPNVAALLLQSIAGTHRDVLAFHDIDVAHHNGVRAVSGVFAHLPSGRPYVIAVAPIPEPES